MFRWNPHDPGAFRPHWKAALIALLLLATVLWPVDTKADDRAVNPISQQPEPDLPDYEQVDDPAPEQDVDGSGAVAVNPSAAGQYRSYMPMIFFEYAPVRPSRIGFNSSWRSFYTFPDIRALNAGWYTNWGVSINPPRPANIQYVQMVRVHQVLTCPSYTTADRVQCPYAVPHRYEYYPNAGYITQAASANPGSTWLIGNEPDRVDFEGGGQDEILPEVYAVAFHDLRSIIKRADPTAKVAVAGVIQFTPLRAEYLTRMWDSYRARYGVDMPVDVWNIHNFIGPEVCQIELRENVPTRVCHGMAIPPGLTGTSAIVAGQQVEYGAYFQEGWKVVNRQVFADQVRGMRGWMKARGQGNKPLIVSEYGVLWTSLCPAAEHVSPQARSACIDYYGANYVDLENPAVVQEFMLWTFEFFRTEKDCTLTTYDDCRLVQQWAWYGLDNMGWGFNPHVFLVDPTTNRLSSAGTAYASYVRQHFSSLMLPNGRLP